MVKVKRDRATRPLRDTFGTQLIPGPAVSASTGPLTWP